jgi:hypothetical protein
MTQTPLQSMVMLNGDPQGRSEASIEVNTLVIKKCVKWILHSLRENSGLVQDDAGPVIPRRSILQFLAGGRSA